ncbi:hypothetical protein PR048_007813 [Dryococelus australis]|uniref:SIAH-type domain-containing protein n=1 Tax=Dryococelus australis TaxID=614101 RepID=A0ABQ9HVD0_9NEOP|nr:hypothetical protein PR048_007813 [Dryococelus australis]
MAGWQSQTQEGDMNAVVLSLLECSVSKGFMRPPIHQCSNGHSVCPKCNTKKLSCLCCLEDVQLIRNFALEELSQKVVHPCKNKDAGCEKKMLKAEREEHILNCPDKLYECVLGRNVDCGWKGTRDQVIVHAKMNHEYTVCEEELVYFSFDSTHVRNSIRGLKSRSINDKFCESYCVIQAHRETFCMIVRNDFMLEKLHVAVKLIGPVEDAEKYVYKVKFTKSFSPAAASFKFITHNYTATMDSISHTIYLSLSLQCAHMDFEFLESFIEDSEIVFVLRLKIL